MKVKVLSSRTPGREGREFNVLSADRFAEFVGFMGHEIITLEDPDSLDGRFYVYAQNVQVVEEFQEMDCS